MSIQVMAKVWAQSQASGSELLLLLAIADFSDDQGHAFPSVATLAQKIRMSPRNTQYLLQKLEAGGELEIRRNAGRGGSNLYRVQTLRPENLAGGCNSLHPTPATACTPPPQPVAPEPSLTINEPSEVAPKVRAKRGKKQEMTLAERKAQCEAEGVPVIPSDSAALRYAKSAGIPDDFIELAWKAFVTRYTEDQPDKRYADWAQTFANAIKGNWLKLWRFDDGSAQYVLTTVGVQEQRAQGVNKPAKRDWV
ncbi:helix-turn-helix domain-containing protein [Massilia orientalis]|uniref:Helix-turn-helix domain-containing protein n=1 Tax=Massilia orientalis TaxID=3050128 RepID=A0ACC7MMV6_9BURK|nr:helix-turn-helix domain-containing protein [Massilia sp. YIM B02787]